MQTRWSIKTTVTTTEPAEPKETAVTAAKETALRAALRVESGGLLSGECILWAYGAALGEKSFRNVGVVRKLFYFCSRK